VKDISGSKGARITFDPVAGPFLEKLAEAAAPGETIFAYGRLSMQPTPFPLITALNKALTIRGYTLSVLHQDPAVLEHAKKYIMIGWKMEGLFRRLPGHLR
jgi:NADPH:quinone reductase-like Zn-dependent oxidoreductase